MLILRMATILLITTVKVSLHVTYSDVSISKKIYQSHKVKIIIRSPNNKISKRLEVKAASSLQKYDYRYLVAGGFLLVYFIHYSRQFYWTEKVFLQKYGPSHPISLVMDICNCVKKFDSPFLNFNVHNIDF